jgi:hypothetical protein
MTVHPVSRKSHGQQPSASSDRTGTTKAWPPRGTATGLRTKTIKSERRPATNQAREGKQDMYSDVEAGCLAPDRISNRTPLMSRPAAVCTLIGHGALAPQCQVGFLDNGFRCAMPAVAYVEFHMVGYCQRFDCDAHGNACGYVCADHLDALEYTAECTAVEIQPTALSQRLFNRVARCPTCDKTLVSASDILQVVVTL